MRSSTRRRLELSLELEDEGERDNRLLLLLSVLLDGDVLNDSVGCLARLFAAGVLLLVCMSSVHHSAVSRGGWMKEN